MKRCKYVGDVNDDYCKNCNGVDMMVEGKTLSCTECAGYEPGDEEVEDNNVDEALNAPEEPVENKEKSESKTKAKAPANTNTIKAEKPVKKTEKPIENKSIEKVVEEKHIEENKEYTPNGIQVTSLRYTSSATVKKNDNYYKFTAEEEWNTSTYNGDIQDVRDQLWAKLNSEVDRQIDELNNM